MKSCSVSSSTDDAITVHTDVGQTWTSYLRILAKTGPAICLQICFICVQISVGCIFLRLCC